MGVDSQDVVIATRLLDLPSCVALRSGEPPRDGLMERRVEGSPLDVLN